MFYEATGNFYRDATRNLLMRVFVAIEISDRSVIDSIVEFQSFIKVKAKPVKPENLHFTMQFLGEVQEQDVNKIRKALKLIKFSMFRISIKGVGAFPNLRSPRIIWIGTDNFGVNILREVANKVENTLSPLGFKSDKPFKSHVTVFRIKNKINNITNEMKKFQSHEFGTQEVCEIKLKQSILTPQGPSYSDIEVIKAL